MEQQQQDTKPSGNIAIKLALILATGVIVSSVVLMTYASLKDYTKKQYVFDYRESNAILLQTINTSQAANGKLAKWDFSEEQTQEKFAEKYITPYMNITKNCKTNQGEGCFAKGIDYKYLNESPSGLILDNSDGYKFIHKNGMSFNIEFIPNCVHDRQYCIDIYVDVNGPNKGPSQFGRDLFLFQAYPFTNELKPAGTYSNEKNSFEPYAYHWARYAGKSDCTPDGLGLTCSTRLIMDGYEMKY